MQYCITVLLYYCITVLLYYCITVLLYYCITVLLYYCITVLLYYCITVLQYYCITVLLYYCITVLLYYCITVLLYYCITVLLYYCITVLLYYCITVLLYYCITVLLYYCITVLLYYGLLYYCITVLLHYCITILLCSFTVLQYYSNFTTIWVMLVLKGLLISFEAGFIGQKMLSDIELHLKSCQYLKIKTPSRKQFALMGHLSSTAPFDMFSIDFLELDPAGGYRYALIVIDHFTRFCQIYPTRNCLAETAASKIFNDLVYDLVFQQGNAITNAQSLKVN